MLIVIRCVIYGAEANIIDQKIRTVFNLLNKESIEAKTLCDLGLVYQKTKTADAPLTVENLFIIHKMSDGSFTDQDGKKYDSISRDFIPINDKVEHQVMDLDIAIESAVDRIEYKIEHFPLKLAGLEMNYELILNFVVLVGSVIVAFMQ